MDPFVRDLQVAVNRRRQTEWQICIKAFGSNLPFGSAGPNTNLFFLCFTKCSLTARVHVIAFAEVILRASSHSPIHSKKHTVVGSERHSDRTASFVC